MVYVVQVASSYSGISFSLKFKKQEEFCWWATSHHTQGSWWKLCYFGYKWVITIKKEMKH
jgi:hypothetical protein